MTRVSVRQIAIAAAAFSALVTGACSPSSDKLVQKPEPKLEKVRDTGDMRLIFTPKVDILFVVDDSGSMMEHQANLSSNIQLFTAGIQGNNLLDFHIGVTTSSMDGWTGSKPPEGRLVGTPNFVDRNTVDGASKLATNLLVGTNGSGTEKFFEPVRAALTVPLVVGDNAGFYRQDAYLAVVFITDADDQSTGLDPLSFYQFLVNLKGDKEKVLIYSAYIPSIDNLCSRSGESAPTRLEQFFQVSGGIGFGLCSVDFGRKLTEVSLDLVTRVGKTLYLSRPPDVSTIEVRYGTQFIPNDPLKGWTFDPLNNALVFGSQIEFTEQPAGTEVEVSFSAAEY